MGFIFPVISAIACFFSQQIAAQLPAGLGGISGLGNRRGLGALMTGQSMWGGQQAKPYRTCVGQTAGGDELRVTFSNRDGSSNWWESDLQVTADITSGSISGLFQLVATEFGRIDGVCESSSLGRILTDQSQSSRGRFTAGWWSQGAASANTIGRIGNSFELAPGKTVSLTDNINTGLTMDRITGGGMALCPVQQIVGNRCVDVISLCCPISRDSRPASRQVASVGPQAAMVGAMHSGMGGMGHMGGMNPGMRGMNAGMGGMNPGMGGMGAMGGMNAGMGGMNAGMGGMNAGMGAMGGMNAGMGAMGGMNAGMGAMGGMAGGMGSPMGGGMQASAFQG